MRIRQPQLNAFAQQASGGRALVHAYAWAATQPNARVDEANAATITEHGQGKTEVARFGPHGLRGLETPEGRRYAFDYDDQGRLTEAGLDGQAPFRISYGKDGDPVEWRQGDRPLLQLGALDDGQEGLEARFADGATERLIYEQDLLVGTRDATGAELQFRRDDLGRVEAVIDARGHAVQFQRDDDDPLGVTIVDANGVEEVWESDHASLTVHVDGELHGRVTGTADSERVEYRDGHQVEIQWDEERPLAGRNAEIEVTFGYDAQGRVIAERQGDLEVRYQYDADGNLRVLTTSDGQRAGFSYDADGQLATAEDAEGARFGFEYADDGVLSRLAFPNGVQTLAGHRSTEQGAEASIRILAPGLKQPAALEHALFDQRGRMLRQRLLDADLSFAYDPAGRLSEVRDHKRGSRQGFSWDAAGNRTHADAATAVFAAGNQILQQGGERFQHDVLGRLTARSTGSGKTQYRYNGQGHLIAARSLSGAEVSYAYDAFGRRVRKTCGNRVTRFLWAGQQLLREWTREGERLIERRDYLFVPGEFQPLAMRVNGQLFCFHLDHSGTPVAVTDARGALAWRGRYDAFGALLQQEGSLRQPFRHLGQYGDDETGLHYNLFRYYDPTLGRYLTPDPLRLRGGSTNFYSYANGDPINQRDPTGHLVFVTAAAIVVGAALVGGLVGGAIGAATAAEGERGQAFAKGFAWGALGGAVGAAVPLIGAAAGLGATAIAGLALAADAAVAGIEACAQGSGLGGAMTAAGISVAMTLATLGLTKIPGVKRALGAVGKRLARVRNKLVGRAKQLWYKLFPGRLQARRLAQRQGAAAERALARKAVLDSLDEGARARHLYPNGIHAEHDAAFSAAAKDKFIIVRDGNPSSIKYQGQPGYTAKPVTCKAKTAKFGPDAGLVVDPTHPRQKAYWSAAKREARGNPEQLAKVKEDHRKALSSWDSFREKQLNVEGSGYRVSDEGQVLLNGKKIHADYDLHGVYEMETKARIDYGSGTPGVGDAEAAALRRKQLNQQLDPTGETEFIQHGGQDDWINPNKSPDPPVTVYSPPDGKKRMLSTADDMKAFYQEHNLEWPYP